METVPRGTYAVAAKKQRQLRLLVMAGWLLGTVMPQMAHRPGESP